ncbi:hypothetical protein GCM10016455_05390 [Aliiroseovarius zhejiangensis]|uniref:Uncharacterized protein n=1 Tax=Aliiroseovarius zhejiangensis TaxID=1632025 RepID=A0ABQ3IMR9_9RHOB|nr:hypothetical protein [Aliiroseovarius zhejiangensis]GHE88192.1 hypothetical protein GCM10016455_05390 [Aliiroseovarius zhejiangensis]
MTIRQAFFGNKSTGLWTVAILLMWFALIFGKDARLYYDEHILPKPWITATVEIMDVGFDKPLILYKAEARVPVSGRWNAWIETFHNGVPVRGCRGSGRGDYAPNDLPPKPWKWVDFFERDCDVPDEPYQICLRYPVSTGSGAFGVFGPYCFRAD